MRLIIALLLAVCGVALLGRGAVGCPVTRAELKQCFELLIDKNIDAQLSTAELNAFLTGPGLTCLPRNDTAFREWASADNIMSVCDINKDGILNSADWDDANGCGAKNPNMMMWVCQACKACGWDEPVKKKKEA